MAEAYFNESTGLQLWKLTTLWQRNLAKELKAFDITPTQFAILAAIESYEGDNEISQSVLVTLTTIDKMTVSKSVRNLQHKKLVKIGKSKKDKRATSIELYAKGKKVTANAMKAVAEAEEEFFSVLSEKQTDTLKKLSGKIMDKT